jgi:2,4-dienoyl-CoA reductase-like NADH-dependent reductase (Old Yellow Enzyme family)
MSELTPYMGARLISEKTGDLIAFGRDYIANPDLAERIRLDAPLMSCGRNTSMATLQRAIRTTCVRTALTRSHPGSPVQPAKISKPGQPNG